jgi:hypothetical protein
LNVYLLVFVSLAYAGTGLSYFWHGQPAWGVFWTCYAVANTAFMVATS